MVKHKNDVKKKRGAVIAAVLCVAFLVVVLCLGVLLLFDLFSWKRQLVRWQVDGMDLLHLAERPAFPIDFVLTWVDAADARWQQKKNAAASGPYRTVEGTTASRFPARSNADTELHIAITSIQRFAPWANRIWVVTQRPQVPPRMQQYMAAGGVAVSVVHHDDMRSGAAAAVDVFSSHAIEADLHNIPGLAEHFIYGNDDTYFGNDVFPRDFFTRSGAPLHSLVPKTLLPYRDICFPVLHTLLRGVVASAVLNTVVFGPAHVHVALTRTGCAETEALLTKDYADTRLRLFRNNTLDVPPVLATVYCCLHAGTAVLRLPTESIRYPDTALTPGALLQPDTFISKMLSSGVEAAARDLARFQQPPPPRIVDDAVLMIVAHPDDETIFGSTDLFLTSRVHVVCMTNAHNVVRTNEVNRVVAALSPSVSVQLLTWNPKDVDAVLQASAVPGLTYTRVVSHAADGEYGHRQHKATHVVAKDVASRLGVPFTSFVERRRTVMSSHAGLLSEMQPRVVAARDRALNIYKSQNIKKYWSWSNRFLPVFVL